METEFWVRVLAKPNTFSPTHKPSNEPTST